MFMRLRNNPKILINPDINMCLSFYDTCIISFSHTYTHTHTHTFRNDMDQSESR